MRLDDAEVTQGRSLTSDTGHSWNRVTGHRVNDLSGSGHSSDPVPSLSPGNEECVDKRRDHTQPVSYNLVDNIRPFHGRNTSVSR